MNKVIQTGRLVSDPEFRTTQNGKSVCNFKIAVDRRIKVDGQPTADFFNCIAWGKTGEFIQKWFTKGKMIAIDGSLQNSDWTDNEGKKHYKTEINVDNAEFCGDKSSDKSVDKTSDTTTKSNKTTTQKKPDIHNETEDESEEDLPF